MCYRKTEKEDCYLLLKILDSVVTVSGWDLLVQRVRVRDLISNGQLKLSRTAAGFEAWFIQGSKHFPHTQSLERDHL